MALTWEEAEPLLKQYRGHLISRSRYEAYLIAKAFGSVHIRQVREKIVDILHKNIDERWMGVVFRQKETFRPTGEKVLAGDASPRTRPGGGGAGMPRLINIWELMPEAECPDFPSAVEKPPILTKDVIPRTPSDRDIHLFFEDLMRMQSAAMEQGFEYENAEEDNRVARWLSYMRERGNYNF
jgi:hypothetical protein